MFRFIRQAISTVILLVITYVVISLYYGGDKFLWLGEKVQETGQRVKQISETAAEKADELRAKKDSLDALYQQAKNVYHRFLGSKDKDEDKEKIVKKDINDRKDKYARDSKRADQDN
ncbi:MAG: hypothetical protein HQL06_07310 [Nitrospirae bacterium]|nr:hypothetical protein [Nitrospirota bacterium]